MTIVFPPPDFFEPMLPKQSVHQVEEKEEDVSDQVNSSEPAL